MRTLKLSVLFLFAAALVLPFAFTSSVEGDAATEAPAGFDNVTNGFATQPDMDGDRDEFDQVELIADGLGPCYNAQSCRECHQNPVTGSSSQITELRAGHNDGSGNFVDAPGGSLINDRAINARLQERVPEAEKIR